MSGPKVCRGPNPLSRCYTKNPPLRLGSVAVIRNIRSLSTTIILNPVESFARTPAGTTA